MKDLRLIGLCNIVYKIIAKIMMNRLQPFMNSIFGIEQSAFIKGGLILDNILINHELIHHLKNRKKGKHIDVVIKLNISKAYDCIEWPFLYHML